MRGKRGGQKREGGNCQNDDNSEKKCVGYVDEARGGKNNNGDCSISSTGVVLLYLSIPCTCPVDIVLRVTNPIVETSVDCGGSGCATDGEREGAR